MLHGQKQVGGFNNGGFVWWNGKVVDIDDPHKNGRLKVEIFGHYDGMDKAGLPWAIPLGMAISHSKDGIGFAPTGIDEGSIVFGFFYDGATGQQPVYIGSLFGRPGGEADTHKNAREKQSIKKKQLYIGKEPKGGQFKEPDTEYRAKYPYNHVRATKNGHVFELDDTEGQERYHYRHPAGTDIEVLKDGKIIIHGVNEYWAMTDGTIHMHTNKDIKISVGKDAKVNVEGNAEIKVAGNVETEIGGNYKLKVGGNIDVKSGGKIDVNAGGAMTLKAPVIKMN